MSYRPLKSTEAVVGMRVAPIGSRFEPTGTIAKVGREYIWVLWDNDLHTEYGYKHYELVIKEGEDSEGDYIDMWLDVWRYTSNKKNGEM